MIHQKSMMKILEHALFNREKNEPIGKVIEETGSGRSSSFEALDWMEKNGLIKTTLIGRQKVVKPIIDDYTLQYKYYIDAMNFKTFSGLAKLIVMILTYYFKDFKGIKGAVLSGNIQNSDKFDALDILILGEQRENEQLKKIKEQIEGFFGVTINFHFADYEVNNIFKGLIVYQSSYAFLENKQKKQYFEFLRYAFDLSQIKDDKKTSAEAFNNSIIHLAFCNASLEEMSSLSEVEAVDLFQKKSHVKTFKDIQQRGIEIGKQIFK